MPQPRLSHSNEAGVRSCLLPPDLRCHHQRLDRRQILGQRLARDRQIVVRLQVQPELGFHAEEDAQARGGIGGDAALAGDDLPDAEIRRFP